MLISLYNSSKYIKKMYMLFIFTIYVEHQQLHLYSKYKFNVHLTIHYIVRSHITLKSVRKYNSEIIYVL